MIDLYKLYIYIDKFIIKMIIMIKLLKYYRLNIQ